jgi:hypothetical protein
MNEFERGVEAARAAFNEMWGSDDWEGQVSLGFASVYDMELDRILWDEKESL